MNKKHIDQRIAVLCGIPEQEVAAITSTFLRLMANDLVRGERIWLRDFGAFTLKSEGKMVRVRFKRAKRFCRLLMERRSNGGKTMDKFGVDESSGKSQEQLEKQASQGCPTCGGKVSRQGQLLMCENCGSQPFEGIPAQTGK